MALRNRCELTIPLTGPKPLTFIASESGGAASASVGWTGSAVSVADLSVTGCLAYPCEAIARRLAVSSNGSASGCEIIADDGTSRLAGTSSGTVLTVNGAPTAPVIFNQDVKIGPSGESVAASCVFRQSAQLPLAEFTSFGVFVNGVQQAALAGPILVGNVPWSTPGPTVPFGTLYQGSESAATRLKHVAARKEQLTEGDTLECAGRFSSQSGAPVFDVNVSSTAAGDGMSLARSATGWTCSAAAFGSGDGCDCDCGIIDPDCSGDECVHSVWVHGDFLTNDVFQLGGYIESVPFTPSVVMPLPGSASSRPYAVSADGTKVALAADLLFPGPRHIFVTDADGSNPLLVVSNPTGGTTTFSDMEFSPDGTKLAYRADPGAAGMFDIYVTPVQESALAVLVSPRSLFDPALDADSAIAWSPDSKYVAFTGDFTEDRYRELYVADTTVAVPVPVAVIPRASILHVSVTGTTGVVGPIAFGQGNLLYARARLAADGLLRIYTASPGGPGPQVLPNTQLTPTSQVGPFALSPDGSSIAFAADGITANAFEVYVMPANGSQPPTVITGGTIPAGRNPDLIEPLRFDPSGTRVAFNADYAINDKFEPYVAAVAGGDLKHLGTIGSVLDATMDASVLAWSGDGSLIYVIADAVSPNQQELFRLDPATTDQALTLVVGTPNLGDVLSLITR